MAVKETPSVQAKCRDWFLIEFIVAVRLTIRFTFPHRALETPDKIGPGRNRSAARHRERQENFFLLGGL